MSDRMSDRAPIRISEYLPITMPDRMSDCQNSCQISEGGAQSNKAIGELPVTFWMLFRRVLRLECFWIG